MSEFKELLKLVTREGLVRLAARHPSFDELINAELSRRDNDLVAEPCQGADVCVAA